MSRRTYLYFKEFPYIDKPWVVVHEVGFGVMECPMEDKGVVWAADTEQEAKEWGDKHYPREVNGTPGWDWYDHYCLYVNISTEKGKELNEKWRRGEEI